MNDLAYNNFQTDLSETDKTVLSRNIFLDYSSTKTFRQSRSEGQRVGCSIPGKILNPKPSHTPVGALECES